MPDLPLAVSKGLWKTLNYISETEHKMINDADVLETAASRPIISRPSHASIAKTIKRLPNRQFNDDLDMLDVIRESLEI